MAVVSNAPFVSEKLIRFHHCDPAGIVFYPQYFILFHELLEDWYDNGLGLNYADMISKERRGLPTAHIDCDFRIPSKIGDTVQMQLPSSASAPPPSRSPSPCARARKCASPPIRCWC